MSKSWPYPGARWWKFDFHTHTPASTDTPWHPLIGSTTELKPDQWLLKYMEAEIDCVAVTDHNSGEWIDRLKTAYIAMKQQADSGNPPEGFRELYLFPGVEISVQGGIHLLAIFDPSATSETISNLLARVEYAGTRGDSDGVTRKGAAEVVKQILIDGGIPIPAHVDQSKGLFKIDSNTCKQVLQEPGLLALEWTSGAAQKPQIYDNLKLNLASVAGSDCHTFQGAAVPGSRYTWIKMAIPSLEGLRLALLDGQKVSVRRSDEYPDFDRLQTPEHFIEAIEVSNARYMGRGRNPARLPLNPWFNALIGGRGTGKSTLLHTLRLAYGREQELPEDSETKQTFERFNKVFRNKNQQGALLENTSIQVEVHRDGSRFRLNWQQGGTGTVVEEWDESEQQFKASDSQSISDRRFPLRLYSQGQIAALAGDNQQALLQVIDTAANTDEQQQQFEAVKTTFLATTAQIRDLKKQVSGRDSLQLSLQDTQRKLARFEETDHATVLKNYQRSSRQQRELQRQFDHAAELANRLNVLASELISDDLPVGLFDTTQDQEAITVMQSLRRAVDVARQNVENAATALQAQQQSLKTQLESSDWFSGITRAQTDYEHLKASLLQQGVNDPSEYGRLVQEKQRLETELKRMDALQTQVDQLKQKATQQLEDIQAARRAISENRRDFLQSTLQNNPFVRIELTPYSRDLQAIEQSLRQTLNIENGRFADDIYKEKSEDTLDKGVIADLMFTADEFDSGQSPNTGAFEQSLKNHKENLYRTCKGEDKFGAKFNSYLKNETDKRPEFADHILCWFPEDGLQVEYSRKGNGKDFQPIGQASAGQRASAMLAFLLAYGKEPLVLDQPEDDLDNHLIYDLIVTQIRDKKQHRQLIIVTHNPNIVVNGDAELIHVMDFNHQSYVKQTGSLQDPSMREEVCLVMEGGDTAFEKRYKRLGKEI